jgi:predicted dehydrogenase
LGDDPNECEDYALAQLQLADGCAVQLACSWGAPAGCDAIISASFHGTRGGATLRNVGGSFYDFVAELHCGTQTMIMTEPPDDWGGRAAIEWVSRLRAGRGFDAPAEGYVRVAEVLDALYAAGTGSPCE